MTDHTVTSAQRHYDTLLADVYAWMVGDPDAALVRARQDIAEIGPVRAGAVAVDLGAGLGLHARALADAGHATVWMIDTSAQLLSLAQDATDGADTRPVRGDLTAFKEHVRPLPVDTILCMGDTLTHLTDIGEVSVLLTDIAASLRPGGVFVTTFRDYSRPATGTERFVPVRADDRRTMTAFLEFDDTHVRVHDVLWQRGDDGWTQRVSSYPKVRLDPEWVADELRRSGLAVLLEEATGGMCQITARR